MFWNGICMLPAGLQRSGSVRWRGNPEPGLEDRGILHCEPGHHVLVALDGATPL